MATAATATEVLKPSAEKTNYTKLARLLMCGGAKIVREVFDNKIPPTKLEAMLKQPTVVSTLEQMRNKKILTFPQWNVLFPSPGTYGKSESFDITLLFKLLREFGGLKAPPKGWDDLPDDKDHSLSADLVRIKYYRNEICHPREDLGINTDDFKVIWERIENALLRMVGTSMGPSKTTDWKAEIDNLLTSPITKEDEINIEELKSWYRHDMEIKAMLEAIPDVIVERLEAKFVLQSKDCQKNGELLVNYLKDHYCMGERALILPFPWMEGDRFHIEKLYTSVNMVERKTEQKVELENLFLWWRRVVIEGEPGMGKSTLCKKIAYDWSTDKLQIDGVELVLVVKCCYLKDGDLWQAIKEQNFPKDLYEKDKEVFNYIRDNQQKILLIVDGFDEFPATADVMKQSIFDLVTGKLLPNSRVIVTSRPEKCSAIMKHFDKKLEMRGFFPEDSCTLIKQFFDSSSLSADAAENVIAQIKSGEAGTASELIRSPLNAAFLCLVLEEKEDNDFFKSLDIDTLYHEMVFCVIKRYCVEKKRQEVEDDTLMAEYHEEQILLGKIALDLIKRNLTSFGEEELPVNSKKILIDIGFLIESKSLNKIRPKSTYRFSHASIKDYFAAFYVAESLREGNIDSLKSIRNFTVNPSASCVENANCVQNGYYSLQRFNLAKMARLSSSNDYVRLINSLTHELPNDIDVTQTEFVKFDFIFSFICELLGKCPAELLTEVINKIEIPDLPLVFYLYNGSQASRGFVFLLSHSKEETSKVKIQVLRLEGFQAASSCISNQDFSNLSDALGKHEHLKTMYLSFFSSSEDFAVFFSNFNSIFINNLGISYTPHELYRNRDFCEILPSLHSLVSLHLFNSSSFVCDELIELGLSEIQSLRILKLQSCNLRPYNVHSILSCLLKSSHSLEVLDLSGNDFSDNDDLEVGSRTLNVLKLIDCNLRSHNVNSIFISLLMSSCTLRELDFSRNDFSDVDDLGVGNLTLQALRMRKCNLKLSNLHSILRSLHESSHTLKELDLSENDFSNVDDLGVGSLKLQALRMRNCNLKLSNLHSILHESSHTLTELDLSENDFSNVDDLGVCRLTLQVLRMRNCNLKLRNVHSILRSLHESIHTLQELDLSENDFSDVDDLGADSLTLQVLRMRNCNLKSRNVHSILSSLLESSRSLQELDLSGNDFSDVDSLQMRSPPHRLGFYLGFLISCFHPDTARSSLQVLRMSKCDLGSHNVHSILSSLRRSSSTLRELDLSENDFSDVHNFHVLSDTLQALRMRNCNLGSRNVHSILSSLRRSRRSLQELDLSGNDFSDVKDLRVSSLTLQVLRMRNCNLKLCNVHSILSSLLKSSQTLQELDLCGNDFSDVKDLGVSSLTLQELRMRNCNLKLSNVSSILSSLLKSSHTLKELDFSENNFSDFDDLEVGSDTLDVNDRDQIISTSRPRTSEFHLGSRSVSSDLHVGRRTLQVQVLRMSNCKLTSLGDLDFILCSLDVNISSIIELDLSGNDFRSVFWRSHTLQVLRRLRMNDCNLRSHDVGSILSSLLESSRSLQELHLSGNDFSDADDLEVGSDTLQVLRMRNCKLGSRTLDIVLKYLLESSCSLKELDLSGNAIYPRFRSAIQYIQRQQPRVNFVV